MVLSEESYSQKQIAARLKKTVSLILRVLKKPREPGRVKDQKLPGRPIKRTKREDSLIVTLANRYKSALLIKAKMRRDYSASTSTTQRRLREAGLHGCKVRKKPHLTPAHN